MDMCKKNSGFTFMELMVVIIIIGLLAAVVGPQVIRKIEEAKQTATAAQIKNLETALYQFKMDNGFYPTTEQGLIALVEPPTLDPIPKKWKDGGYLEKDHIPLDPWGNDYYYLSPGVHNRDFDVFSYGADGEEGGERENADIGNWVVKEERM
ncbi:MAG: type II secretion system major pseudopilin GspG [Candidatus Omnitrophica bacterium]|nr:type II secretion system major pseudopilin GspG [Candidatus Omnitrophota bacterium]